MRDVIGLAALTLVVGAAWFFGSLALLGVGGALVMLLCWHTDRGRT